MRPIWNKHIEKDEAKELEDTLKANWRLFEIITSILEEKIEVVDRDSIKVSGYDCPNWAYKQADIVGYKRAVQEMIKLFSEDSTEK